MPVPGHAAARVPVDDAPATVVCDLAGARAAVLRTAGPLPAQTCSLDAAVGRFAARSVIARADLVPYARSAMDGYAVRSADTRDAAHAPRVLRVRGSAFAGGPRRVLEGGSACAIATGGALPEGADAVVPWEAVDALGDAIVVRAPLVAGDHVFVAGDDARAGEAIVAVGERITVGRAALLAAAGASQVDVVRAPRVTIVSNGDELVDVGEEPAIGQIRDSNAVLLAAAVARDGGAIVAQVRVPDTYAAVVAALRDAARDSDLVLTTGGASTGERDHVKRAARELGARIAFTSVALRPGRPAAFATLGTARLGVLPGNPAAAFVAYSTLFGPLVRALAGDPRPAAPLVRARLTGGALHAKEARHYFAFARLHHDGDAFVATILANQCSSLVRTSADANAFAVVPPGERSYPPGSIVEVEVFDWTSVAFHASRDARTS